MTDWVILVLQFFVVGNKLIKSKHKPEKETKNLNKIEQFKIYNVIIFYL